MARGRPPRAGAAVPALRGQGGIAGRERCRPAERTSTHHRRGAAAGGGRRGVHARPARPRAPDGRLSARAARRLPRRLSADALRSMGHADRAAAARGGRQDPPDRTARRAARAHEAPGPAEAMAGTARPRGAGVRGGRQPFLARPPVLRLHRAGCVGRRQRPQPRPAGHRLRADAGAPAGRRTVAVCRWHAVRRRHHARMDRPPCHGARHRAGRSGGAGRARFGQHGLGRNRGAGGGPGRPAEPRCRTGVVAGPARPRWRA